MKKFFAMLVLIGVTIATPVGASFNVWDMVSDAPMPTYETPFDGSFSVETAIRNARKYLPFATRNAVDLEMTLVLAKLSLTAHYPNSNAPTNALLLSSLPSGDTGQREVRWLAAFMDEVQSGYASLEPQIDGWYRAYRGHLTYYDWETPVRSGVSRFVLSCNRRAKQIVTQMQILNQKRMMGLASDVQFVRNSARVKLGEIDGFMLTAGSQNLNVTVRDGGTPQFWAPLTTVDLRYAARIAVGTAGSATAHVTAKSLPVLIKVGSAAPTVLERNGNQSLVASQVAQGVKVWVLEVPVVTQHVDNQSVAVGVEQTVNYAFGGELLRYSVASSQTSVATVRITEPGIAAITGVRAGNSTITISATNASGTAVISFVTTVTAD